MKNIKLLALCLIWFSVSGIITFTATASAVIKGMQSEEVVLERAFETPDGLITFTVIMCVIGIIMSIIVAKKIKRNEKHEEFEEKPIQVSFSKSESDD
jgi:Na+/melibiose symporter-like transporter